MRIVWFASLPLLSLLLAAAGPAPAPTIDFPCFKNLSDGRVLVDGDQWDRKLRDLGYVLEDGAYVPYEVLSFQQQKARDAVWADGTCHLLLPPPRS